MFDALVQINTRPGPWEFNTPRQLWTDPHISRQMLSYHLHPTIEAASRSHAFIKESVSWLTGRFCAGPGVSIADFGCGPGLYTLPLTRAGATVTGIDFSENSLGYARERAAEAGASIEYVQADYLEFTTEQRFDLIIMIYCDYTAIGPAERGRLLDTFYRLLKPDGSVVLDVYQPAFFRHKEAAAVYERNHMKGFWSAEDYFTFANTFKYEPEQLVLDKYTVVEASRTRTFYTWQQTFTRETLTREFEAHGLHPREWYADVAGARFEPEAEQMAVVAGKA
jgi:SAM-dependent methyltransferase